MNDTIAAISSSGGPIGLIRVSGERAIEAINAVFQAKNGKPLTEAPSQKLVYGHTDGQVRQCDRLLLRCRAARTAHLYG